MQIIGPTLDRAVDCEAVLQSLPMWFGHRGVRFLQVKTVAASSPSMEYAETRKFYERRGFTPIEVFPTLWDPHNPALQYIKVLNAT
jgi:hypothetical protein